jgi:hypothetical protein
MNGPAIPTKNIVSAYQVQNYNKKPYFPWKLKCSHFNIPVKVKTCSGEESPGS